MRFQWRFASIFSGRSAFNSTELKKENGKIFQCVYILFPLSSSSTTTLIFIYFEQKKCGSFNGIPVGPSENSQKLRPSFFSGWHLLFGFPHRPLKRSHSGPIDRPVRSLSKDISTCFHVGQAVPKPFTSNKRATRTKRCLPGAVHNPCEPCAENRTGWFFDVTTVRGKFGCCKIPLRVSWRRNSNVPVNRSYCNWNWSNK